MGSAVPSRVSLLISILRLNLALTYYGIPLEFRGGVCPPLEHTNSGCGKREARNNWSVVVPEKATSVTGTTVSTTGTVPAETRR